MSVRWQRSVVPRVKHVRWRTPTSARAPFRARVLRPVRARDAILMRHVLLNARHVSDAVALARVLLAPRLVSVLASCGAWVVALSFALQLLGFLPLRFLELLLLVNEARDLRVLILNLLHLRPVYGCSALKTKQRIKSA